MKMLQQLPNDPKKCEGFTLVELAIVLVIIGLLIGGVLVGQSLIKAAEIRALITESQNFLTAIATYRARYDQNPGDGRTNTKYWGAQDPDYATCAALTTPPTDTSTCNGDGDGYIASNNAYHESYRLWQQLSNAELVSGYYNGIRGPDDPADHVIGVNAPASKMNNGMWSILTFPLITEAEIAAQTGFLDQVFLGAYGNVLVFGGDRDITGAGIHLPWEAILTPEDALQADSKMDDGKPGTGRVRGWRTNTGAVTPNDCSTTTDALTAQYNVIGSTDRECGLFIVLKQL